MVTSERIALLKELLTQRVLVIDGAMGTAIQAVSYTHLTLPTKA